DVIDRVGRVADRRPAVHLLDGQVVHRQLTASVVQVGVAVGVVVYAVRARTGNLQRFRRTGCAAAEGHLFHVAPAVAVAVREGPSGDANRRQIELCVEVAVCDSRVEVAVVADTVARGPAVHGRAGEEFTDIPLVGRVGARGYAVGDQRTVVPAV